MGYYTNYKLEATGFENAEAAEFFEFKLRKVSEYSGWDVEINSRTFALEATLSEAKWYDWQKDLEGLSKQFPNVTITVDGVGEEPGDIWRARVKNGLTKTAKATISFDGLDD
jgi:hypothetical protein